MGDAPAGSAQAAFAATLVDEWVRCGVRTAVVCPGSRSTPLALACARHPDLDVAVVLDERSAGFVALGAARAAGRPVVVVVTSGTAAAELHAAVVESDLSGIPLLVCTADRPPELHGVGAPQTIDQRGLYGGAVRAYVEPGVPEWRTRGSWRSLAARAAVDALGGSAPGGPVHCNLAFADPLIMPDGSQVAAEPGRPGGRPWHAVVGVSAPEPEAVAGVAASLVGDGGAVRPGVLVAGAGSPKPEVLAALAERPGWPIVADPRSGWRKPAGGPDVPVVLSGDLALRSGRLAPAHLGVERIVRVGAPPASKVVNQWVADAVEGGAELVVVGDSTRWPDPERIAATVLTGGTGAWCTALTAALAGPPAGESWGTLWRAVSDATSEFLADLAIRWGAETEPLVEPAVAQLVCASVPPGGTLVVSSSMPIRDVEAYALPPAAGVRVVANRGANGIDGVVSSAIGSALGTGGDVSCLVGDLAFLHDAGALAASSLVAERGARCTVVVVDNRGGGIFSFLAQGEALEEAEFEALFGTPPSLDVASLAAGYGVPVAEVGTTGALFEALGAARERTGLSVIVAAVPSRAENVAVHRALAAEALSVLDAALGAGT